MANIRNFVIVAHIDHGKSTLADRMIEITKAVEARKMRAQYLDQLELERERGITIKMAPTQMHYWLNGEEYILNLIDTPGHSDFSYEVSRSLAAVEGAVLLIDGMQGIQAQTIANFYAAKNVGLHIVGAVNKIDLNPQHIERHISGLAALMGCSENEILRISAKTSEGVAELIEKVIHAVPEPRIAGHGQIQALIFDSHYDEHKGVIAYVRMFGGKIAAGMSAHLMAADEKFIIKEVGIFTPELKQCSALEAGAIGWVATGIKDAEMIKIGDTIGPPNGGEALPGYTEPQPVVFVSLYPDPEGAARDTASKRAGASGDMEYEALKVALQRLRLNDYALTFSSDFSPVLGRGFKCGFLGRLHFEITVQRLEREFGVGVVTSFPSVAYTVRHNGTEKVIQNPNEFPDESQQSILQPMARLEVLTPPEHASSILRLKERFHLSNIEMHSFADRAVITAKIPVSDLMQDFDDKVKSISGGFASFTYTLIGEEPANVEKLEIHIAGEPVPGLTRIVADDEVDREGREMVKKLKDLLPRQQFPQALQALARGRIIARETIPAMKKDVTGYLYGGDRTRKMKLWKKQKEGKKRLTGRGRVSIPSNVFKELLKK